MLNRLLSGLAIALALCTVHSSAQNAPLTRGSKYVALGSSFASGPGVAEQASDSAPSCMQSSSNYPHLLAARRGLQLTDRTCSGAKTADLLTDHQNGLPPQITAVNSQTRLVTITIGGNDLRYIGNLYGESCQNAPERVPGRLKPGICEVTSDATVQTALAVLPQHMHDIVAAVRERSPSAVIVFVNYVGILPPAGTCTERAPLTEQEIRNARLLAAKLVEITSAVAGQEHTKLLDADKLSQGHDVCSSDPWIFPFTFPSTPATFAPAIYHPNLKAMQGIAEALDQLLE
jgi:hypothetical protein